MTCEMCCGGQAKVTKSRKEKEPGKLKEYLGGRDRIRKDTYRIKIIKLIFKSLFYHGLSLRKVLSSLDVQFLNNTEKQVHFSFHSVLHVKNKNSPGWCGSVD